LGHGVVFKDAYDTGINQVWYLLIDIHFILRHVKFENGLSTTILKTRATCLKNLQLEIIRFLKMTNVVKARPPAFFLKIPCA
jgi:hypothetical protein